MIKRPAHAAAAAVVASALTLSGCVTGDEPEQAAGDDIEVTTPVEED